MCFDAVIAHVPGKYGYLGGTGLFIGSNASVDQQAHAWGLAQLMMMNASSYAKLQQSPPPFEVHVSCEKGDEVLLYPMLR